MAQNSDRFVSRISGTYYETCPVREGIAPRRNGYSRVKHPLVNKMRLRSSVLMNQEGDWEKQTPFLQDDTSGHFTNHIRGSADC